MSREARDIGIGLLGVGALLGGAWLSSKLIALLTPTNEESPDVPLLEDTLMANADPNRPPFPYIEVEPGFYLRADAARGYIAMRNAAKAVGIVLRISTAFRSVQWQAKLYARYIAYKAYTDYQNGKGPAAPYAPWAPLAAKPDGNGPHQRGRAIDFHGFDTKKVNYDPNADAWMQKNAASYGWKQTGLTFSMKEPWHWYFEGSATFPLDDSLVGQPQKQLYA